ncbi:MAG: nitroreductase family protein [Deltaproteobacteria bacterium]|nr:nitroreductase family protein [Deltaproteobacteria bacterium]MBI2651544.1 nitroreductase family protein [Candidatus Woesearchaeota archaeon]
MEVFDAIRGRRSIRKYKDKLVPWDNIITIMQAGKYAPCAGNLQNWKFIVVKTDAKRKAIAQACLQQEWMENAPIFIVVVAEPEKAERYYGIRGSRLYTIQGCAAAIQNMLLTAHSLGLGACWVGAFDEDEIIRILNLEEDKPVQGVITIGYADENPEPPPKYRIEHMMFFEKWWGRVESPRTHLGWWSAFNARVVEEGKKLVKKTGKRIKERIEKVSSKKQQK